MATLSQYTALRESKSYEHLSLLAYQASVYMDKYQFPYCGAHTVQ